MSASEISFLKAWYVWVRICVPGSRLRCRRALALRERSDWNSVSQAAFSRGNLATMLAALLFLGLPSMLLAQTDCLSCHADKTMQDAAGHSVGVDADTFHASIHGSLSCTDYHTSIKQYPHPDKFNFGQVRRLTPTRQQGWAAACTPQSVHSPALAAMAMRTASSPRPMLVPRSTP